jgi:hypothetical protein
MSHVQGQLGQLRLNILTPTVRPDQRLQRERVPSIVHSRRTAFIVVDFCLNKEPRDGLCDTGSGVTVATSPVCVTQQERIGALIIGSMQTPTEIVAQFSMGIL